MYRLQPLLFILLIACGAEDGGDTDSDQACTPGALQCDGDILEICDEVDGWVIEEDCAESEMECHAMMGHCM
jgi:hypothetical protein